MRYGKAGIMIAIAVGAAVGYAVESGKWFIAVIAVIAGLLLLSVVRRRTDEIIKDERTLKISERASRRAIEVFCIGAALVGAVMLALDLHRDAVLPSNLMSAEFSCFTLPSTAITACGR
jgi:uncharacterized membrane protein